MTLLETLSDEQRYAYESALERRNIFISGPGGVGKSYLLGVVVDALRDQGRRVTVASSTGISAISVGGATIHSCLGTKLNNSIEELKVDNQTDCSVRFHRRMGLTDTLVIDEVSMLSGSYIEMTDYWLRRNKVEGQPFGGLHVIFMGDLLQLPPVEDRDKPKPKYRFAFEAPSWTEAKLESHQLMKSFRQDDQTFVNALNQIRFGEITDEVLDIFRPCVGRKLEDPLKLLPTNTQVDRINWKGVHATEGELRHSDATFTGPGWAQKNLVKNCIVPEKLQVKIGSPVLICKNDIIDGLYANGTRGIVRDIASGEIIVETEDGIAVALGKAVWEYKDGQRVVATMYQFPLRLAHALTIHKSQGMTLSNVEIDLRRVFAEGQTYVALSRVRSLEGLSLTTPLAERMVKAHPKIVEFYRNAKAYD